VLVMRRRSSSSERKSCVRPRPRFFSLGNENHQHELPYDISSAGRSGRCGNMLPWRGLCRRSVKSLLEDSTRKPTRPQSRNLCIVNRASLRLSDYLSSQRRHVAEMQMKKDLIRNHIHALQTSRRKFSNSCALSHGHLDPPKPGEEYVHERALQWPGMK
jgi:hypothetical protein